MGLLRYMDLPCFVVDGGQEHEKFMYVECTMAQMYYDTFSFSIHSPIT